MISSGVSFEGSISKIDSTPIVLQDQIIILGPGESLTLTFPTIPYNQSKFVIYDDCALTANPYQFAAYFYVKTNSLWSFSAILVPNSLLNNIVIDSIDLSLPYSALGSINSKSVYVFKDFASGSSVHSWSLLALLSPSSRVNGDLFGWTLTFSLGKLYVGAPKRKILDTDQVGAVDIFEQNTNLDWVYSTSNYNYFSDFQSRSGCYLTSSASNVFILPCPNASSLGGSTVLQENSITFWEFTIEPTYIFRVIPGAISESFVMIGYPYTNEGYVATYHLSSILAADTTNRNGVPLYPSDGVIGDHFGTAIAIKNDNIACISSPYHNFIGAIYIYKYNDKVQFWDQIGKIFPSKSSNITTGFGFSMSAYMINSTLQIFSNAPSSTITTQSRQVVAYILEVDFKTPSHTNYINYMLRLIILVVSIVGFCLCMIFICWYWRKVFKFKRLARVVHFHSSRRPEPSTEVQIQENKWIIPHENIEFDTGPYIGIGGFALVQKGIWKDGSREYPVAIKILKEQSQNNQQMIETLHREAAIMVQIRNPYVVQVYGLCDNIMLVMEYMPLGSLQRFISTNNLLLRQLTISLQLIIDCVLGIEYLHLNGVIHSDLKSPNILLCEEGGSLKAKIADFGLSRIGFGDNSVTTKSHMMSLKWAPPEMFHDKPKLSKAIDVYSMGMIMWEIMSLKLPYDGLSIGHIVKHITSGGREVIPDDTPREINRIIRLCWEQDPHNRPKIETIKELLLEYRQSMLNPHILATMIELNQLTSNESDLNYQGQGQGQLQVQIQGQRQEQQERGLIQMKILGQRETLEQVEERNSNFNLVSQGNLSHV